MVGCWTCRTRKKKCNQEFPSCSECSRLGIDCVGYGKRPSWADGGTKEARYKRQVKEHIKCKARQKRSESQTHTSELNTTLVTDFDHAETEYNSTLDNHFANFFGKSSVMLTDFAITPAEVTTTQAHDASSLSRNSFYPSPPCTAFEDDHSISVYTGHDAMESFALELTEQHHISANQEEQTLRQCQSLMHYLDQLFWKQFPMYKISQAFVDRSWILICATSCYLFKNSLTQLSKDASHQSKFDKAKNLGGLEQPFGTIAHDLMAELRSTASRHVSETPERLYALLPATLITTYRALVLRCSGSLEEVLSVTKSVLEHIAQQGLSHEKLEIMPKTALSFSISQAIYVDTLYAAIQRSMPILNYLELPGRDIDLDLCIETSYGCSLAFLTALRKITQLDSWKRELSIQGRLDVPELVSRGQALLADVAYPLLARRSSAISGIGLSSEAIPSRFSRSSTSSQSDNSPFNAWKVDIDQLYANAASIYIHVIMSGANPNLPDIQKLVENSVQILQGLRSLDAFACLTWPLMIISCLAAGERRETCHFIISRAAEEKKLEKTFKAMLDVAQDCWRLSNESPLMQWDWRVALDNLGMSSTTFILPT